MKEKEIASFLKRLKKKEIFLEEKKSNRIRLKIVVRFVHNSLESQLIEFLKKTRKSPRINSLSGKPHEVLNELLREFNISIDDLIKEIAEDRDIYERDWLKSILQLIT